jgi:cytochrome c peroxidase
VACASCHKQENAFADNSALSSGFQGMLTERNSKTIVNSITRNVYFWDNRTKTLEELVLQPVQHHVEMGMEKIEILPKKIAVATYYAPLFQTAFGSIEITSQKISFALSQFLRVLTTYNSKADSTGLIQFAQGSWNSVGVTVTPQELRGATLFTNKGCNHCHTGSNLGNTGSTANIGLEMNYKDAGIGVLEAGKEGVFNVPSLRNIAVTAPYMHDGRFKKLEDVINHYNNNVLEHPNVDTRLRVNVWSNTTTNNPLKKLNLSPANVQDLVAFLNTLTDKNFITDPKFSNPFVAK